MTKVYLLGSIIVFIYLLVMMYKDILHEGFTNLRDNTSRLLFIFILSCFSWVSILVWIYIRIRKKL